MRWLPTRRMMLRAADGTAGASAVGAWARTASSWTRLSSFSRSSRAVLARASRYQMATERMRG